jgi:hypothetical protein
MELDWYIGIYSSLQWISLYSWNLNAHHLYKTPLLARIGISLISLLTYVSKMHSNVILRSTCFLIIMIYVACCHWSGTWRWYLGTLSEVQIWSSIICLEVLEVLWRLRRREAGSCHRGRRWAVSGTDCMGSHVSISRSLPLVLNFSKFPRMCWSP